MHPINTYNKMSKVSCKYIGFVKLSFQYTAPADICLCEDSSHHTSKVLHLGSEQSAGNLSKLKSMSCS